MSSVDELYMAALALPPAERLRLVEMIVHDLTRAVEGPRPKWMDIEGVAPHVHGDEDAQAWVSRTRGESDERAGNPRK